MELGQKLRLARQEAGLSQRQLCGDYMTRNMLSQIENGTARPSMDTLSYLAARLGKSVSYFLEEQAVTSPNQEVMAAARKHFAAADASACRAALADYQGPDEVFDLEYHLLLALACMEQARQMISDGRLPFAAELLEQAGEAGAHTPYYTPALERQRLLLLGKTGQVSLTQLENMLPGDEDALLLKAEAALLRKDYPRCTALLAAAQEQTDPLWQLLQAEVCFAAGDYTGAVAHYTLAEENYPAMAIPKLEACYRELGDFRRAYEYACRQR